MSRIHDIVEGVLLREGRYVDHPNDRGGPTNWGITEAVARLNGYVGHMRDMPQSLARSIYHTRYVTTPWFDRVAAISLPVAEELVDTGVNMGPAVSSVFFQRWLNGFNQQARRYGDLFVDGRVGPATISAFGTYLQQRGSEGELVMVAALNGVQANRYLEIAERDKTQEDFLYGWVRTRVLGLK